MTVEYFFSQYPNAPGVIQVGTDLYLLHRRGAAADHARRHGLELEEISNPALVGPDDTGDTPVEGPDDTGDVPVDGPDEKVKASAPAKKTSRGKKK